MKKILNLLATLVMVLVLVACGVNVPENTDVTYTNKEYYPNLYIENIFVQYMGDKNESRDANQEDISKIMKVLQTTYKGVSIGDTVTKLDSIYGEHVTSVVYYENSQFGKFMDVTLVWGEEEIAITVPATYTDDSGYNIAPLQINKEVLSKAYKVASDSGMSKEEALDEVKGQFFQPMVLVMNGEEAIKNVEFDKIDEAISKLEEEKNSSKPVAQATQQASLGKDLTTDLPLLFPIENDAKEVFDKNASYLLPFNHMGESIDTVSASIGERIGAKYVAWTLNYGPNGMYDLTATYFDSNQDPIADLSFGLDSEFIANTDIWFNDYKTGKSLHEIDVIQYAQGN